MVDTYLTLSNPKTKALNLTRPSVIASSLLILITNSFKGFVRGPCWADASTTCHTELLIAPKLVSKLGFSPSLRIAYKAGHNEESASLAHVGFTLASPSCSSSSSVEAGAKYCMICSTASWTELMRHRFWMRLSERVLLRWIGVV